ncbi:permease [Pleomorphomonas sp. PLEO]|uniref:permease n=1 Tax=Pleomorphomonas sp. PLEO TaxID=3239306 RepID=UPI00351ED1F2
MSTCCSDKVAAPAIAAAPCCGEAVKPTCGCGGTQPAPATDPRRPARWLAATAAGAIAWIAVYPWLEPLAETIVAHLPVDRQSPLGDALAFVLYDLPKVLMLLVAIVFVTGFVRSYFSVEATRRLLAGKRLGIGNVAAATLGVATPFCSCSAVPLFLGFVSAGVPLGVTFSFLIAAPMVNEVALGLLFALVGWQVALTYLAFGLTIAILSGLIIGQLRLEGWLQPWVRDVRMGVATLPDHRLTLTDRLEAGWAAVKEIVAKVWLWVALGIGVGALIHGYAPTQLLVSIMGKDAWWSVPAAVVIGIPMYASASTILPIIEALIDKGAALGTVLAFMMAVIALSLPEMIILKKVLTAKLIAVFIAIVGTGILTVGYLFNLLFA